MIWKSTSILNLDVISDVLWICDTLYSGGWCFQEVFMMNNTGYKGKIMLCMVTEIYDLYLIVIQGKRISSFVQKIYTKLDCIYYYFSHNVKWKGMFFRRSFKTAVSLTFIAQFMAKWFSKKPLNLYVLSCHCLKMTIRINVIFFLILIKFCLLIHFHFFG